MANYQSLKAAINAVIKANGNKEITGTVLNEVLLAMVNSLGAGYQFAGVATPSTNPGTPDQKVFYIASQAGTYTNFNGAVVSDGIAIFEWNGTWTTETLDLSIPEQVQSDWTETDTTKKSYIKHKPNIPPSANVDPVPTEDSPNAVSSGGTYDMIVRTAATLFGDIQDSTNVNAIESVDGKIYNDYQAGDIFFIVDNNVRKYRVALVAGTADSEHPVTISPVNFYYAINSADAINLSLTLKTVSTEQQSLSTQQKAQARTNIAAVSYDQQSLNAGQQVQAQNNIMGKAYAPIDHSGLGKMYLAKNDGVLAQSMFEATDMVYVLQYAYTLSENIEIPARCTLAFDGGSIKGNGSGKNTITGNNTTLIAQDGIFEAIKIAGSWNCPEIKSSFFKDEETVDVAKQLVKLSSDNMFNIITLGSNKTFRVNVDGEAFQSGLWLKSNTRLIVQGTLKTVPNNLDYCNTIICYNKENIEICGGGIIMGDKDQHTGSTGEFGMGVHVGSSRNVYIHDVEIQNCWGDGIQITCITGALGPSTFCSVRNCYIHNIRRNGIGIGYSSDINVQNCEIADVSGTNPQAAIDIEPDGNNEFAKNISIRNVVSRNCLNGIEILNIHTGGVIDYISIDSCRFVCNYTWALRISNGITNISVSNSYFESTQYAQAVTLSVTGDIMFSGCSFKGKSTETGKLIENFDSAYNLYFYGCSFNAPKADVLTYASNVRMISCNIAGANLSKHSIRNTVIDSSIIDGLKFNSTAKHGVKITRCTMNLNAQTYLQDASDITISGNTINITSTENLSFVYANRCRFLTIADNIINNVNDVSVGVILQTCSYTRLDSNPVISSDGTTISEIGVNNISSTFNKQDSFLPIAGTTRPTGLSVGTMYYDESLNKPIWYKGNNEWVDATGTVVS